MANEFIDILRPKDFYRANGSMHDDGLAVTGSVAALRLAKSDTAGFFAVCNVPGSLTQGTGHTYVLHVCDDGADASDLGKVVRLGITVKELLTGADTLAIGTSGATEVAVDVTLDATTGELVVSSNAIANASLDSIGVGDSFLLRIRRIGTHANDTCQGPVLLTHVVVKNT
jgi:hypothetical protein